LQVSVHNCAKGVVCAPSKAKATRSAGNPTLLQSFAHPPPTKQRKAHARARTHASTQTHKHINTDTHTHAHTRAGTHIHATTDRERERERGSQGEQHAQCNFYSFADGARHGWAAAYSSSTHCWGISAHTRAVLTLRARVALGRVGADGLPVCANGAVRAVARAGAPTLPQGHAATLPMGHTAPVVPRE
jgi:hypothetical protein